jgi:hypothetical protein
MITYKQQFDRLTRAYINDEVDPYKGCACFIGNLLGKGFSWEVAREFNGHGKSYVRNIEEHPWAVDGINAIKEASEGMYTPDDIVRMENNFLYIIESQTNYLEKSVIFIEEIRTHPNYEEALFNAFSSTLDMLKEIHITLGEDVESYTFTKRQLQTHE